MFAACTQFPEGGPRTERGFVFLSDGLSGLCKLLGFLSAVASGGT